MSMAGYIKSDLKARLRTGRELPAELTLESLAGHYEVSFTPVRAAVAALVAEGLLLRGPNRRLSPVRGDSEARNGTEPAEPLPEPPRDLLKVVGDDLVRLSLGGEAVYLREEAAARRYGVSRSAIRNILHQLAGVGLLVHIPRRGWQVRPFRLEDMQAFLAVRELLELQALESAWPRLVSEDLQAMLDRNEFPDSDAQWPRVDHSLHGYIIEKAGNPYITDFFERHGRYYDILFDWEDQDRDTALETVVRHRQILEAMLSRDRQAARSALSGDIRSNHPRLGRIGGWETSSRSRSGGRKPLEPAPIAVGINVASLSFP